MNYLHGYCGYTVDVEKGKRLLRMALEQGEDYAKTALDTYAREH